MWSLYHHVARTRPVARLASERKISAPLVNGGPVARSSQSAGCVALAGQRLITSCVALAGWYDSVVQRVYAGLIDLARLSH